MFTARYGLGKFYVLSAQCIYVFCVDLRTNSDCFPTQHCLIGFLNPNIFTVRYEFFFLNTVQVKA